MELKKSKAAVFELGRPNSKDAAMGNGKRGLREVSAPTPPNLTTNQNSFHCHFDQTSRKIYEGSYYY